MSITKLSLTDVMRASLISAINKINEIIDAINATDVSSTITPSDVVTAATDFSIGTSTRGAISGHVCHVYIQITTTNALTQGTSYVVGSLKDDYKPRTQIALASSAQINYPVTCRVTAAGEISIRPRVAIPAGQYFVVGGAYIRSA